MNPNRTRGVARRSRVATLGFSLVEILIAVLVLGVGLLGLASVFPVVISQQRDATDVIRGGVASAAIRDQIRSNPDIIGELLSQDGAVDRDELDLDGDRVPNDPNDSEIDSDGDGVPDSFDETVGEEPVFGLDREFNPTTLNLTTNGNGRFNPLTGYSYLWEADWEWGSDIAIADGPDLRRAGPWLDDYRADGGIRFRDPRERQNAGVANRPDLPVTARLYPRPYSSSIAGGNVRQDGPQFVWDFVPRRTAAGDIQAVVFVRRISTGIRVGAGETLSGVLSDTTGDRVFPVSVDENTGFPTTDGSGRYSVPLSAVAEPISVDEYSALADARASLNPSEEYVSDGIRVLPGAVDQVATVTGFEAIEPLAEVGQKFVDNLGVVRTVIEVLGVVDGTHIDLRVEPAFTRSALKPPFTQVINESIGYTTDEAARIGKLRQIVFTPQIPVDVFTMEFSQ